MLLYPCGMEKEVRELFGHHDGTEQAVYQKADMVNRFLARFIDFLVIGAFATSLQPPIGALAAITYSLIADGFFDGQSIGKKLIGLKVINVSTTSPCDFKDSIIRNSPIGLIVIFYSIPFLGWFLLFTGGVIVVIFEGYLIYTDDQGLRVGDIMADTQVVDIKTPESD